MLEEENLTDCLICGNFVNDDAYFVILAVFRIIFDCYKELKIVSLFTAVQSALTLHFQHLSVNATKNS